FNFNKTRHRTYIGMKSIFVSMGLSLSTHLAHYPFLDAASQRDEAIVAAFESGGYTLSEIADFFGLHYTTVGRIVRKRVSRRCLR
nr:hypothetical protein [Endozoicomonas sp.]